MDGDGDATVAALHSLGATNLTPHCWSAEPPRALRARTRRGCADAAALADVAWIEPSAQYSFNNDKAQWVVQSGVQNSRPVTDHGIRGQGQVVMIGDSGLPHQPRDVQRFDAGDHELGGLRPATARSSPTSRARARR